MKHKVFLSHSSMDKEIANAICHFLEADGIPCWIAPRDIERTDWAGSIMKGIQQSDVFVVILSQNSIPSAEVIKEVTEATRVCKYILPFKVDNEMLSDRLRYHLAPCHWLDAINPPLEKHIEELKCRIRNLSDEDTVYGNTNRQSVVGTAVMPKSFFVGRSEEIGQIHEMLQEEHVLFVQGMGGIGKSEIVKGYAKTYADCYDVVLFANYRGSITDMVIGDDIEITNLKRNAAYGEDAESEEAFFKRKLQALKNLSNSATLLIVDNFDTDYDEHLEELINGPYTILFTTRYEQYDYPCMPVGPIREFDTVRQLFKKNFARPIRPQDQPMIDEILNLVNCHTITVELIAKQMRASFITPEKMLKLLKEEGMSSGGKETVKRGGTGKSAFDFIKDLFKLSGLSDDEKYLLKCMCLVPFSGIEVNRLENYLKLESFDVVNDLIAKSWLMLEEETYFLKMHPIIHEVIKDALQPNQSDCKQYILGVWEDFHNAWFQTDAERAEKWPYLEHILQNYGTPVAELWQQYADFVNFAWICGKFELSIKISKEFYQYTLREFGEIGYKPCFAARAVAGAYYNAGDEKSAEPYYFLALEHMLKKPEESLKEVVFVYEKVGRCAYLNGNYGQSEEYLQKSLDYIELAKTDPKENMTVISGADTYVQFARMYMAKGDYKKALEYCETSYDIFYAWKGCEIASHTYCLSDMGICYSMLGEYEKAEEYLKRALALNIQFNGEHSLVTMRTKEAIADHLARCGKTEEAARAYLELELEMEKNFGSECSQVLRLKNKYEKC